MSSSIWTVMVIIQVQNFRKLWGVNRWMHDAVHFLSCMHFERYERSYEKKHKKMLTGYIEVCSKTHLSHDPWRTSQGQSPFLGSPLITIRCIMACIHDCIALLWTTPHYSVPVVLWCKSPSAFVCHHSGCFIKAVIFADIRFIYKVYTVYLLDSTSAWCFYFEIP